MSSSDTSSALHLDNTLGAAFIGLICAAILFGVTNMQSLLYFQSSGRDPKFLKLFVATLWIIDILQMIFLSHSLYNVFVSNFTNLTILSEERWSLSAQDLLTIFSDFLVRLFFTKRLWTLSDHSKILTGGSILLTLVTFVSGFGFIIKSFSLASLEQIRPLAWVYLINLICGVISDLWIASGLCWYLSRKRTGSKASDSIVRTIMAYTISTGISTGLCALVTLITFVTMPYNYIFIAVNFVLSKLYFNSLLASLNARGKLQLRSVEMSLDPRSELAFSAPSFRMARFIGTNGSPPTATTTTASGMYIAELGPLDCEREEGKQTL